MAVTDTALPDTFSTPGRRRDPHDVDPVSNGIGNPMPFAIGLLIIQLSLFGMEWITTDKTGIGSNGISAANTYALGILGFGQFAAGVICFFRGEAYRGQVAALFGLWAFGAFLLAKDHSAPPLAVGSYLFALIVPLVLMMIPAVRHRAWSFVVAFGSVAGLCAFAGFGFVSVNRELPLAQAAKAAIAAGRKPSAIPHFEHAITMLHTAAIFAFVAVATMIWVLSVDLLRQDRALVANPVR